MMKCLTLLVAVIVHMICSLYHYEELISCSAFAPCPNLQRRCNFGIVSSFIVMAVVDDDNNNDNTFHPLGPPTFLSNLKVCETITATTSSSSTCRNHTSDSAVFHHKNITRLSSSPDIFVIRNLIASSTDRQILIDTSIVNGMKNAGTKSSEDNTIRKHSYLTWIDPHGDDIDVIDENCYDDTTTSKTIARDTIINSRRYFAHEMMNKQMEMVTQEDDTKQSTVVDYTYSYPEELQIVKYDIGGKFDYHHDGYGRYLTVISYLNGVAGTYFPFANDDMGLLCKQQGEKNVSVIMDYMKQTVDKYGTLIVGKEGTHAYTDTESESSITPRDIIEVQAGDAIAFYSYDSNGDVDQRSVHCSLTVPLEKWISTCWFRSEALTGPFRSMKITRMEDDKRRLGI